MRYLPLTASEREKILKLCGVNDFESLINQVPKDLRVKGLLDLEKALSEIELIRHNGELAKKNEAAHMQCHLGQGVYDHSWPVVIDQITNRGEFLTAYTPYQPELSQGTLQVIFEFQSMIADLTAMEVSNASLYDGPTSLVEGILMSARLQGLSSGTVYVSEGLYSRTRTLLETYLSPLGFKLETWRADPKIFRSTQASLVAKEGEPVVAMVMQSPNKWGLIEDWAELSETAKALKTKSVAAITHMHTPAIFAAPGEKNVDIVVGEAQALGIPVGFGGPHLGFLACKKIDVRQMPGRVVGATVDAKGERAFCVTLSTREQHIRREKATSNICSNQNLMATRATLYMTLMGPEGLKKVAELSRSKAYFARKLLQENAAFKDSELKVMDGELFNEITILVPQKLSLWTDETLAYAEERKILAGIKVEVPKASGYVHGLTLAFTEKHSRGDVEKLVEALTHSLGTTP